MRGEHTKFSVQRGARKDDGMTEEYDRECDADSPRSQSQEARVRLPGFINDEDVGLGDAIRRVTDSAGIRRCRGCDRRAEILNRWVKFAGRTDRNR